MAGWVRGRREIKVTQLRLRIFLTSYGCRRSPRLRLHLVCHKLATSSESPRRRMADFCGLRRTALLWQKRPRRAVCLHSNLISYCFSYGGPNRDRTDDLLHAMQIKCAILKGFTPRSPQICHKQRTATWKACQAQLFLGSRRRREGAHRRLASSRFLHGPSVSEAS